MRHTVGINLGKIILILITLNVRLNSHRLQSCKRFGVYLSLNILSYYFALCGQEANLRHANMQICYFE